jgi:hypothetical protein
MFHGVTQMQEPHPSDQSSIDPKDRSNVPPRVSPPLLTPTDADMVFKYYLHQWEQVRHCENMRSSISLQLFTVVAGSVAGFFYLKGCAGLQASLAIVVVIIGEMAFFVVRALEVAADIHIGAHASRAPSCRALTRLLT